MKVKLAYGRHGLVCDLPDDGSVTVVEPAYVPGLPDTSASIRQALRAPTRHEPLAKLVREADTDCRIGIIFSDITRPTPNHIILPVLLSELREAGVSSQRITLFNALGTHRPETDAELRGRLGDAIVDLYRIVQNNAFDATTQVNLGVTTRGHEIWLNRELVACDIKILTGFIEPHFFAGFSGGGKAVMPGMAGQKTVLGNHDADMIGNPHATWGVTWGNPIWEEAREVALRMSSAARVSPGAGVFLLNVALNKDKQITGVFAGDLDAAHAEGCAFVKKTAMVAVQQPFDIVVTTNSGYPLDLNLYQTIKGMSAAAQVVREGGAIIAAAECSEGIPEHGLYGRLLREASSPRELLNRINTPGFLAQDQWEAQIQALIQLKADAYLRSDGLTDQQVTAALLRPCHRIEETLSEIQQRRGSKTTICVMPEGPQTVAYVSGPPATIG